MLQFVRDFLDFLYILIENSLWYTLWWDETTNMQMLNFVLSNWLKLKIFYTLKFKKKETKTVVKYNIVKYNLLCAPLIIYVMVMPLCGNKTPYWPQLACYEEMQSSSFRKCQELKWTQLVPKSVVLSKLCSADQKRKHLL